MQLGGFRARCYLDDGLKSDRGSAVVDFVLVGGLLSVLFIAIVQLALIQHVRNTLVDAAASGARYGTFADRGPDDGVLRTRALISAALNAEYAQTVQSGEADFNGLRTLEITVRAPLPVIGLIGPAGFLEVKGHAALQP